jgi:alpha-D-ribose 1-methylphosphonate 5-triphosphate synthase subunit PhnG
MTARSDSEAAAVAQALRRRWLGILACSERAALEPLAAAADLAECQWLRRPEVGMVMLRGRMGGTGAQFNLGEATVTRCTLKSEAGHLGCGHVLGRDARHAELMARVDATLQDPAAQARLLHAVIEPLAAALEQRRDRASRQAASTRVEFFTLVRE